jgi:branched-chain amino acid transport system permease protein
MSTFVLLTITGLALGAMYFLVASGLSLIYGLMGVLNFAHGLFLLVGAYATWWFEGRIDTGGPTVRYLLATLIGVAIGAAFAGLVEVILIRPLYGRHTDQILVTVGLALAGGALIAGIWGGDARPLVVPGWMVDAPSILGTRIPNDRWVEIAAAVFVLVALEAFLRRTRYGLIIRAGVENRAMVTALGINVQRAFTLVFVIGGAAAALAGSLTNVFFLNVSPERGANLLIFAFIVVVIGGLTSIRGCAMASVLVGLTQQYANYYFTTGAGDLLVIALLAIVLLVRPTGLSAKFA